MHQYLLTDPLMRTVYAITEKGKQAVLFKPLPAPVDIGGHLVTGIADIDSSALNQNYWGNEAIGTALTMLEESLINPSRLNRLMGESFVERFCNLLEVANENLEISFILRTDEVLLYVDVRSGVPYFDIHVLDKVEIYHCNWSMTQQEALDKMHTRHAQERRDVEALFNPLTAETPKHAVRLFHSDKD